ncbi:MAG: creatininase family protein [Planctomycetota bacterium]|nr:creatininase family protein [Planctomycetota bacterium]
MNDFILAEQTHHFIRQHKWDAAVLPFGATEPHNLHMPYGTDTFQVDEIARRACAHAYTRGAKVLLLPTLPFGVNTNQLQIPAAVTLSVTPTTLLKILADLVDSLERQGVRKLLLLNGHGGNELKPLMRELHHRSNVFLFLCDWYKICADQYPKMFEKPSEHADEVETSLALAFFPQFVKMTQAGKGEVKPCRFEAVRKKWISLTRPWHLITTDTGIGDPTPATPEKGQALMALLTTRIGDFLHDLATTPIDKSFPF